MPSKCCNLITKFESMVCGQARASPPQKSRVALVVVLVPRPIKRLRWFVQRCAAGGVEKESPKRRRSECANSTNLALPSRILHSSLAAGIGCHAGPASAHKLLLRRAFGLREGLVRNLAEPNRRRRFLPGQTRPAASNRLGGRSYAPPQRPTERGCSTHCSVLREAGV